MHPIRPRQPNNNNPNPNLKYMKNIPPHNTFDDVKGKATERVKEMSESMTKKLKAALEHGLADLTSDDEMDMYLSLYGTIHKEKLQLAFNKIPYKKILSEDKISVIDYGCGQGIASMVLCDFLQSIVGHPYMISDFHLIEPSKVCIKRAIGFLHDFNPDATIVYFNNPCEDIMEMAIRPKSDVVIHLFSNVIDMPDFPRETVARKLNDMNDHYNIVVCVSPFYQENGRAKYMDEFGKKLRLFHRRHSFEKHTDEWDKPYSCQMRIYVSIYY